MSPVSRADVVQQFEHSPVNGDSTHDFSRAYQSIVQLQRDDGGASSPRFQNDMTAINRELHHQGLIPNCDIVGVDGQSHLITRDRGSGVVSAQDASHMSDVSPAANMSGREREDQMIAQAFGLTMTKNADGSYNLTDPFENPNASAAGILNTVFNGLLGGGSSDTSGRDNLPIGMNPLLAQAWNGWNDDPTQPTNDSW